MLSKKNAPWKGDGVVASCNSSSFKMYLRDIRKIKTLSQSEEASLSSRIHAGDEGALNILIEANLRFVVKVAIKIHGSRNSLGQVISAGNIGLISAAKNYEAACGIRFISYAESWIHHAIVSHIQEEERLVHIPNHRVCILRKIKRSISRLEHRLERVPTISELSEFLSLPEPKVRVCLESDISFHSMESISYSAEANPPNNSHNLNSHCFFENHQTKAEELDDIMARYLKPVEAKVLRQYYGINGDDASTLKELSLKMGISPEGARKIRERALEKLRQSFIRPFSQIAGTPQVLPNRIGRKLPGTPMPKDMET